MKKLLILMIMLFVGFGLVFAAPNPAQPPGVFEYIAAEKPTVPMAEYVISFADVTQPSALVATPTTVSLSSIMFDTVLTESAVQTNSGIMNRLSMFMNTGQAWTGGTAANYLRC